MKIYDISMTVSKDMMVYKDQEVKKPKITPSSTFETSSAYESLLQLNMHTGTHIDAPLHMIPSGEKMATYTIDDFVAEAIVLDFSNVTDCIREEDLKQRAIQKGDFVLLKTSNSSDTTFNYNFIYLEKSGADYLSKLGVVGVGIDALGIERAQPDHDTHKTLFNHKIMIVEGLRLKEISEGRYQLIVLPLKVLETEAAPARAILIQN